MHTTRLLFVILMNSICSCGNTIDDTNERNDSSLEVMKLSQEEQDAMNRIIEKMQRDGITNDDSRLHEEFQNNPEAQKKAADLLKKLAEEKMKKGVDGGI